MTSFSFDESLRETLKALDSLPARIEANLVRGALRAAARPILEEAKANAPQGSSGRLQASVRVSTALKRKEGEVVVQVKAGGQSKSAAGAYYAHMVEFGTAKHIIRGPVVLGGKVLTYVRHPGAAAKPFMRPAFDNAGQSSVDAYAAYMRRRLPQALAKHGTSGGEE